MILIALPRPRRMLINGTDTLKPELLTPASFIVYGVLRSDSVWS